MYSKEQREKALELFDRNGSITRTIQALGYPTRRSLYTWIQEREAATMGSHRRSKAGMEPDEFGANPVCGTQNLLRQVRHIKMCLDAMEESMSLMRRKADFNSPLTESERECVIQEISDNFPQAGEEEWEKIQL